MTRLEKPCLTIEYRRIGRASPDQHLHMRTLATPRLAHVGVRFARWPKCGTGQSDPAMSVLALAREPGAAPRARSSMASFLRRLRDP